MLIVPPTDNRASAFYGWTEVKCMQHAHAVGLNQKAGPHGMPSRVALNKLRHEALSVEGGGQGEPGESSADD